MKERFKNLEILAETGKSIQAQHTIVDALYKETFYQDFFSGAERLLRLMGYTEKDNLSPALYPVETCLVAGKLGKDKRSESERFQDLVALIPKEGCMHFARGAVANAITQETLRQQDHTPAERFTIKCSRL